MPFSEAINIPVFRVLVTSPLGFKARVGNLIYSHLAEAYVCEKVSLKRRHLKFS